MKKFLLVAALLISPLYALPIGNPMDASLYSTGLFWEEGCGKHCSDPCFTWCDAWSLRLGFYGDYVYNRHMEELNVFTWPSSSAGPTLYHTLPVSYFEVTTNAGLITLNLCNRVDVFATLGTSSIIYEATTNSTGGSWITDLVEVRTESGFAWSAGGRLTLWNCGCFYCGLEGQYAHSRMPLKDFYGFPFVSLDKVKLDYSDWQVGLGISYFIPVSSVAFIPYAGLKWAGAKGSWSSPDGWIDRPDHKVKDYLFSLKASKHWGWGLGLTMLISEMATVTVEGRWADEKAFSLNGQFRF